MAHPQPRWVPGSVGTQVRSGPAGCSPRSHRDGERRPRPGSCPILSHSPTSLATEDRALCELFTELVVAQGWGWGGDF